MPAHLPDHHTQFHPGSGQRTTWWQIWTADLQERCDQLWLCQVAYLWVSLMCTSPHHPTFLLRMSHSEASSSHPTIPGKLGNPHCRNSQLLAPLLFSHHHFPRHESGCFLGFTQLRASSYPHPQGAKPGVSQKPPAFFCLWGSAGGGSGLEASGKCTPLGSTFLLGCHGQC